MNGFRNELRNVLRIGGIGVIIAAAVLALGCESPVQNYTRDQNQNRSVGSAEILDILKFDVKTNGSGASIVQGQARIDHYAANISFVAASAVLEAGKTAMGGKVTYFKDEGVTKHRHGNAQGIGEIHSDTNRDGPAALIPVVDVQGSVVLPLTERYIDYMFRDMNGVGGGQVNQQVKSWAEQVRADTGIGLNPDYIFELINQQNATGVYIEPPPATFEKLQANCLTVDFTQPTDFIVLNVPQKRARRYHVTPAPYTARPIYVNAAQEAYEEGDSRIDGSDWARAFKTLDEALKADNPNSNNSVPKTIWVAKGDYEVKNGFVIEKSISIANSETGILEPSWPSGYTEINKTIPEVGGLEIVGGFSGIENAPYEPKRNPVTIKNMTTGGSTTGPDAEGLEGLNVLKIVGRPVTLEAVTLDGGAVRRPVYIKGGSLTLKANAVLTGGGGSDIANGGGVYITGNGSLNITGGHVVGNKARAKGGGVYVDSGTVILNNGFALDSKKEVGKINYNTAGAPGSASGMGGGIYIGFGTTGNPNGKLTFANGEIRGNISFGNGGGAYVDIDTADPTRSGAFFMGEGSAGLPPDEWPVISGNIAYGAGAKGGGVFVSRQGSSAWASFVKQGTPAGNRSGVIFGADDKAPNPDRNMSNELTRDPGTTANIAGRAPETYTIPSFDLVNPVTANGHAVFFASSSGGKDSYIGNYASVDSNNQEASGGGDPRIQEITVKYGGTAGRPMSVSVQQPWDGSSGFDEYNPKVGLIKITVPADAIDQYKGSTTTPAYQTATSIRVANSSLLLEVADDFQGGSLSPPNGNLYTLFADIATLAGGGTNNQWNTGSPYLVRISGGDHTNDSWIYAQTLATNYNADITGYIAQKRSSGGIDLNSVITAVGVNRYAASIGTEGYSIVDKLYNYGKAPWFVVIDSSLKAYIYMVEVVLESGAPIYVDAEEGDDTAGNGSNWGTAYETIEQALLDGRAMSGNPVEIWLKGMDTGTFAEYTLEVPTVRETVSIIGGFGGRELTKKARTAITANKPEISFSSALTVANGSNITLLDATVFSNAAAATFTLNNGSSLTLGDGIDWSVVPIIAKNGSKITINGVTTLENTAIFPPVIGNTATNVHNIDAAGGSIQLETGSQLILTGDSAIHHNTTGYGVVLSASAMTMTGTTFNRPDLTPTTVNQAPKVHTNAGGIKLTDYSSLTITDTVLDAGASAPTSYKIDDLPAINYNTIPQIYGNVIEGGSGAGSEEKARGGGIYVDKSSVVMDGGVIRDNQVTGSNNSSGANFSGNGAGVYLGQNAVFTMKRGHIRRNIASVASGATEGQTGNGGGVYLGGATGAVTGEVSSFNNNGTKFVFDTTSTDLTSLILENQAARGGGAYLRAGSVLIRGPERGIIYGSGTKSENGATPKVNIATQSGPALYDENGDPNIAARSVAGGAFQRLEAGGVAVTVTLAGNENHAASAAGTWGASNSTGEFNTILPPPGGSSWSTDNKYAKAVDLNELTEFKLGSVSGTIIHGSQTGDTGAAVSTPNASEIRVDISLSAIQGASTGLLAEAMLKDGSVDLFSDSPGAARAFIILPLVPTDYEVPDTTPPYDPSSKSYSGEPGRYYATAHAAAAVNEAFPAPANGNDVFDQLLKQGIAGTSEGANMDIINTEAAKSFNTGNRNRPDDTGSGSNLAHNRRLLFTSGQSLGRLKFQTVAQKNVIIFYVASQKGKIRQYRLVVNVFSAKPIHVSNDGDTGTGSAAATGDTWNTGPNGITKLQSETVTALYSSSTSQDVWIKHKTDNNGYSGGSGGTGANGYLSSFTEINGATLTFTGNFAGTETVLDARPDIDTTSTNPKGQTKVRISIDGDSPGLLAIKNHAKVTFRDLELEGNITVLGGSQLILENTLVRGQITVEGSSSLTLRDSAKDGKTTGSSPSVSYGKWAGVRYLAAGSDGAAVILGKDDDSNDSSSLTLVHGSIFRYDDTTSSGDTAVTAVQMYGASELTMRSQNNISDTNPYRGEVRNDGETGFNDGDGMYRSRILVRTTTPGVNASIGVDMAQDEYYILHNPKFNLYDGLIYDYSHGIGCGVYVGGAKSTTRSRAFFTMHGGKIAGFSGAPAAGGGYKAAGAGVKIEAGGAFWKKTVPVVPSGDTNTSIIRGNSYIDTEKNTSAVVDFALVDRTGVSITGDTTATDASGFAGGNTAAGYAYYTQEFGSASLMNVNVNGSGVQTYPLAYPLLATFKDNGATGTANDEITDMDKYLYLALTDNKGTLVTTLGAGTGLRHERFSVYGQTAAYLGPGDTSYDSTHYGGLVPVGTNGVALLFDRNLTSTSPTSPTNIVLRSEAFASQEYDASIASDKLGAYTAYFKISGTNTPDAGDWYAHVGLGAGVSVGAAPDEKTNWMLIQEGNSSYFYDSTLNTNYKKLTNSDIWIKYGVAANANPIYIFAKKAALPSGSGQTAGAGAVSYAAYQSLTGSNVGTGDKYLVVQRDSGGAFWGNTSLGAPNNWQIVHEGWSTTAAAPAGGALAPVNMDDEHALLELSDALTTGKDVYVFAKRAAITSGDIALGGVQAYLAKAETTSINPVIVDDRYIHVTTGGTGTLAVDVTNLSSTNIKVFQKGSAPELTSGSVRINNTNAILKLDSMLSNTDTLYMLAKSNVFTATTATLDSIKPYYIYATGSSTAGDSEAKISVTSDGHAWHTTDTNIMNNISNYYTADNRTGVIFTSSLDSYDSTDIQKDGVGTHLTTTTFYLFIKQGAFRIVPQVRSGIVNLNFSTLP